MIDPAFELDSHQHRRGHLLYAASGVVVVSTEEGAWIAPPERAIWKPGGCRHSVRMIGATSTRSVLIEPDEAGSLGPRNKVIAVSPLPRDLLVAACDVAPAYEPDSRDGQVMALLLAELLLAPVVPLAVPIPKSADLARKYHSLLDRPRPHDTIDDWCDAWAWGVVHSRARSCAKRGAVSGRGAPAGLFARRAAPARGRRAGDHRPAGSGL